jgi:hypothetical protein
MEHWGNHNWQEMTEVLRGIPANVSLSPPHLTYTVLGLNLVLHSEKSVTNHLSYDVAWQWTLLTS